MKKKKFLNIYNFIFLLYCVFVILLLINHEYGRDEFQVWLMVKKLSFFEIILQMKYEGHPCLWHLIIKIFAELNFSYCIMGVISTSFALLGVWILLYKSSFEIYTKCLICFSFSILFCCSVFARSYSLIFLLVMCLAWIYKQRKDKPIIYNIILFLLVNTHVLVCGLVGMLLLKDLYEILIKREEYNRKKRIIGIIIAFLGILLLFLQLYKCFEVRNHKIDLSYSFSDICLLIIYYLMKYIYYQCRFHILQVVSFVLLLGLIYFFAKEKKYMFFVFIGSLGFKLLVHIYVYELYYQQSCLLIIDLIFCLWCADIKNNKILNVLFSSFIFLTIPYSLYFVYLEMNSNYSDSYNVARYIKNNINPNSRILCLKDNYCTSIIGYLDDNYKFISLYSKSEFSYIVWNNDYDDYYFNEKEINELINNKEIDYIIDIGYDKDVFDYRYAIEYKSDFSNIISDEGYTIYRIIE